MYEHNSSRVHACEATQTFSVLRGCHGRGAIVPSLPKQKAFPKKHIDPSLSVSLDVDARLSGTVFLGAAPVGFLGHVDELHAKGVVGVINMCGEYRGPVEDYNRLGVEQLWLPTVVRYEQPQRVAVELPLRRDANRYRASCSGWPRCRSS